MNHAPKCPAHNHLYEVGSGNDLPECTCSQTAQGIEEAIRRAENTLNNYDGCIIKKPDDKFGDHPSALRWKDIEVLKEAARYAAQSQDEALKRMYRDATEDTPPAAMPVNEALERAIRDFDYCSKTWAESRSKPILEKATIEVVKSLMSAALTPAIGDEERDDESELYTAYLKGVSDGKAQSPDTSSLVDMVLALKKPLLPSGNCEKNMEIKKENAIYDKVADVIRGMR